MKTVKEITGFQLERLTNGEHFSFAGFVHQLIAENVREALGLDAVYAPFDTAYQQEEVSLKQEQGSLLSDIIAQDDAQNDTLYRYLSNMVSAQLGSPVAATAEAAKTVRHLLDTYGDVTRKSYADELGLLKNLIQDCGKAPYKEALATLVLTPVVESLTASVTKFENDYNSRNVQTAAAALVVPMKQARPALDAEYRYLVKVLNALWLANDVAATPDAAKAALLEGVIDPLNARIVKEDTLLAQKKGRSAAAQKKKKEQA